LAPSKSLSPSTAPSISLSPTSSSAPSAIPSTSSAPSTNLIDELLENTTLLSGFDVTFGIEFNLNEMQSIATKGLPIDQVLRRGIALKIDTWGAFAAVVVDPIELEFSLLNRTITIHDTHLAMSVELRSRGPFSASVESLINGTANTTALLPNVTVPFSSEVVLDVPVEGFVLSPIIKLESTNLANLTDADFAFDFDVDLSVFLDTDVFGNFTLDKIIQNATALLGAIASLGPKLNAGGTTPSALDGLFNIVGELGDLGGTLETYIDLVGQGTPGLICFHCFVGALVLI
jgi:hypothetical protein